MIYKYLPRVYAERLVNRGEVLFRTLSYFRAVEHRERGDAIEGIHIDSPDGPATLENLTTGRKHTGAWRFLNSVDQSQVFAWCCSTILSAELFEAFEADACVAISDIDSFSRKCQTAARRAFPSHKPVVRHGAVRYWAPNREAPLPVKEPSSIPFLKHESYSAQNEYRFSFALRGGQILNERVVHGRPQLADEIAGAPVSEKRFVLGRLSGIAEVLYSHEHRRAAT